MTILHVDSSINLETSATRAISKSIVDRLMAAGSGEHPPIGGFPETRLIGWGVIQPNPTTSQKRLAGIVGWGGRIRSRFFWRLSL